MARRPLPKPRPLASPKGSPPRGRTPRPEPEPELQGELIHGLRAGLAVFDVRPADILRVGYDARLERDLRGLLHACSGRNIKTTALSDAKLAQLAQSDQHEGLVIEARPRRFLPPAKLAERLVQTRGLAVAFDRVRNPYNIGAVLRTAAFFGVDAALLGTPAPHPALPAQAVRVAEGGAEHLALCRTTDLAETLARLRSAGVFVVGAEDYGNTAAATVAHKRPLVLVVGHEREGLSDRVRAQCDAVVAIQGSGQVRSLNVSIAASILIAQIA